MLQSGKQAKQTLTMASKTYIPSTEGSATDKVRSLPIQFSAPSTRKIKVASVERAADPARIERRLIVRQDGTTYTTVSDESLNSLLGKLIGKHAKQIGLSGNYRYAAYANLPSDQQEANQTATTALDAIDFDLDEFSCSELVGDVLVAGADGHSLTEEDINALSWLFEYVRVHRDLASCEVQARCPMGFFSMLWE
jgi:hypothetical protein